MPNTFTPEQISQILEEFFKVVGTRQYIGARYVPIFGRKDEESIEWDNTAPYEPLTVVLYQGNSYTSRQFVPVGVEITNQEFWAITGNYNAQVEMYRRETAAVREIAEAAQNDVDTLLPKADFSASNTVKKYVDDLVATVQADIDTLLPKADFSAENTVKKYVDDSVATVQADIDTLLPKNAFDENNTVKDYVDKNNPYIFVSAYGAIGDGITDDSVAIQNAINACASSNDKKFLIFDKALYLAANLNFVAASNVTIIGNGATLIHNYKNGIVIDQNCHDIAVNNMRFIGKFEPNDTETSSNSCIVVSGVSNTALYEAYNIEVRNCHFNFGVFGIAASNVKNLTVENCYFTGGVYRPEDSAGGYCILEQSCIDVKIENCFFEIGDYGRHDIYISVRQPKTENRQSKNIYIHNCFSDRSNMRVQANGAYFSSNTVRVAIRSCVNLQLDGFYAIGGTGIVALNNGDGEIRHVELKNIITYGNKYITGTFGESESRMAVGIIGSSSDNYSECVIDHLTVIGADTLFQDVQGQADIINIKNTVVNYQIQVANNMRDTHLLLENVGVKAIGALSYNGTGVLKGKFTNLYNASSNEVLTCGVCENSQGRIAIECYQAEAKICRLAASETAPTWMNNYLAHPFMTVEIIDNEYRKITTKYCTKPRAGLYSGIGSGNMGTFYFDPTHDTSESSARLYSYNSSGVVTPTLYAQLNLF